MKQTHSLLSTTKPTIDMEDDKLSLQKYLACTYLCQGMRNNQHWLHRALGEKISIWGILSNSYHKSFCPGISSAKVIRSNKRNIFHKNCGWLDLWTASYLWYLLLVDKSPEHWTVQADTPERKNSYSGRFWSLRGLFPCKLTWKVKPHSQCYLNRWLQIWGFLKSFKSRFNLELNIYHVMSKIHCLCKNTLNLKVPGKSFLHLFPVCRHVCWELWSSQN